MIINLTQHVATPEQRADDVVDLPAPQRARLQQLLTFEEPPTRNELDTRADEIAELACQNGLAGEDADSPHPQFAMIGGAPFLMSALERALEMRAIEALYAFSRRESVEEQLPDGSVRKTQVFRHVGFV